ncbi:hypothetical protein ACFL6I_13100 [candidate division KSB1 bacterium]
MPLQIGIPLNKVTFASLPADQQSALKAFFDEVDDTIKNPDDLKKEVGGLRFIPPEELQATYNAIVKFGGDAYCPVRQRAQLFAFEEEKVTVH